MRRQPWRMTFRYAAEGVMYALRTQVNMRIHVAMALFVIVAGLTLHISRLDWLFVCVAIAIVIVAELFNTAVEAAVISSHLIFIRWPKRRRHRRRSRAPGSGFCCNYWYICVL